MNDEPALTNTVATSRISKNPALRLLWLALGLFFAGLGMLGYVLPLLPGTVFLIVAAFFFARSSPRLHRWLLNNRLFGAVLRDWFAGRGLPRRVKLLIVGTMALSIAISGFLAPSAVVRGGLVLAFLGGSLYVLTRPTRTVP